MLYNSKVGDYLTAHAKIILAILTIVIHRFVTDGTGDWVIDVVGLVLIGLVPNNEAAIERIYPQARAKRLRNEETGETDIVKVLLIVFVCLCILVALAKI